MRELLIAILILNSLFWGLMPHSIHCQVVSKITSATCPPHIIHIVMGIISFMLAVIVAQQEYFSASFTSMMNLYQMGGRMAKSIGHLVKKSLDKFDSIEHFSTTMENVIDNM